jgi:hypothetical protein
MSIIKKTLAPAALVVVLGQPAWAQDASPLADAGALQPADAELSPLPAADAGSPQVENSTPSSSSPVSAPEQTKAIGPSAVLDLETRPSPAVESNVISLVDREGLRWRTPAGDFEFNPYLLLQMFGQAKYVDNAWLNLADQDNVTEFGFGTANALFGIAGKGFGRLTFNLTLNPACSGGCLLNQAWVDAYAAESLRVQVGKFKTPMHWSFQVRIGQNQFPRLPASLTARVNLPFGLNAVNPTMLTGFDTGAMAHGVFGGKLGYQIGLFSGEGIGVNSPTSTLSDDLKIPGFLYAGRLTYTPFGPMPLQEGGSDRRPDLRMLIATSASYNVEANAESSNDLRAGVELALVKGPVYWASEAYLVNMSFVERQRGTAGRTFWGACSQIGYRFRGGLEPVVRLESFDRNSTSEAGVLLIPAVGLNYYFSDQNLKLQAMYQGLARIRYANDLAAHQDDNGMPDGLFVVQLQFVL